MSVGEIGKNGLNQGRRKHLCVSLYAFLHKQPTDLDSGVPRLEKEEIIKKEVIGKGMFGVVWLGTCRGMDVAVKILHAQDMDDNGLKEFEKEVSFMR